MASNIGFDLECEPIPHREELLEGFVNIQKTPRPRE